MTHIIKTSWNGLKGVAECESIHGGFYEEGRSQAEALSRLLAKMAKRKEMVGTEYEAPNAGLRGVIGQTTRKGRRGSISEMATFELVGGVMHGGENGTT